MSGETSAPSDDLVKRLGDIEAALTEESARARHAPGLQFKALAKIIGGILVEAADRITALEATLAERDAQLAAEKERTDKAFEANERDRSIITDARNAFKDALARRTWLLEGRGSYEWDDDRWKDEFRQAIHELEAPMEVLYKIGVDWSLCPISPEEIAAARIDWKSRAEAAESLASSLQRDLDAGWQPIETAPKNGDRIFLFAQGPSSPQDTYYGVSAWYSVDPDMNPHLRPERLANWWDWPFAIRPTHWRPLPVPPVIQAAAKVAR